MAAIALGAALALSGCGNGGDPKLMNLRSKDGPDEFSILPQKPLEMPKDLGALPSPTPGGGNRTDQNPMNDAIVALGGTPSAGGGIPTTDSALYAHANRYGTAAGIRGTLAAEDLDWRRRHDGRLLEKLFSLNVYSRAYSKLALDQYDELAFWRARGVATPSAPPKSVAKDRAKGQ